MQAIANGYEYGFDVIDQTGLPSGALGGRLVLSRPAAREGEAGAGIAWPRECG